MRRHGLVQVKLRALVIVVVALSLGTIVSEFPPIVASYATVCLRGILAKVLYIQKLKQRQGPFIKQYPLPLLGIHLKSARPVNIRKHFVEMVEYFFDGHIQIPENREGLPDVRFDLVNFARRSPR